MVSVPREARSYQGTSAGVVTRLAAGVVDVLVVAVALAGSYAAWVALVFVLDPRRIPHARRLAPVGRWRSSSPTSWRT